MSGWCDANNGQGFVTTTEQQTSEYQFGFHMGGWKPKPKQLNQEALGFQPVSFEFQEFETAEEPMKFETLNEFDFMESFGGNNQNKISQHFLEPQKEAENFGF